MSQSNDTYLNILSSYAYMGKDKPFAEYFYKLHREGRINGMIDSGAFTKHNAKGNYDHITLDKYCEWLTHYKNGCEKYVMLDVVGKAQESRKNYEAMVARGLKPMFVLTMYDNDWDYFNDTLAVTPHCCVAGGVTTKGDWLKQRFQRVYQVSNGKALIHGLGYVVYPMMYQLPLASVDSSSWTAAERFGGVYWFDDNGYHSVHRMDFLRGKKKLPPSLIELLEQWEITPAELVKEQNWHGGKSIANMSSIIAYLKYQKYSYRQGLRLFLAVGCKNKLDTLLYLSENYKTITYDEYKKTV